MHLIIDIRNKELYEASYRRYGQTWAELWSAHHPGDSISYLVYEHESVTGDNYIRVPERSLWVPWWEKLVAANTGNEVFRCVNFSPYLPYDRSIPTVSHIYDNASTLYPDLDKISYLARKRCEYEKKSLIHHSTSIIVPNIHTGSELVEIYSVPEYDIEVIPYVPMTRSMTDANTLAQFQIIGSYYLYDGGYGSGSGIVELLKWWETYRSSLGGTYSLVLHGYAGGDISIITQTIRSFSLEDSVRYVGSLPRAGRETLYAGARGWVMAGSYYSGGPTIELALAHDLPLLIPDIATLETYPWLRVRPNHLEELGQRLMDLETYTSERHDHHDATTYMRAYEKILMKGK
jgi:hypothetical protein